ncbi:MULTISPECIES: hypothetical protein [Bacillaceae]|uniref:Uncharacterized protein n=1 Tax=Evansella alkalicola TaxID=745819 RepID=A0ABS6K247_9BACI|nr:MULTISPECIES: hypothetical protein [Bacillaceae]MBU9723630.1 hypothetical protein [Bacillus alkalicola]
MQWIVEDIEIRDNVNYALVKYTNMNEVEGLEPTSQILVDSERHEFVYILDHPEGYSHLRFTKTVWGTLERIRRETNAMWVSFVNEDHVIEFELEDFWSELHALIENIRGNSNYGDSMVQAVEDVFN